MNHTDVFATLLSRAALGLGSSESRGADGFDFAGGGWEQTVKNQTNPKTPKLSKASRTFGRNSQLLLTEMENELELVSCARCQGCTTHTLRGGGAKWSEVHRERGRGGIKKSSPARRLRFTGANVVHNQEGKVFFSARTQWKRRRGELNVRMSERAQKVKE